eukprot:1161649-Pelagomonas_calceolata.AAC.7
MLLSGAQFLRDSHKTNHTGGEKEDAIGKSRNERWGGGEAGGTARQKAFYLGQLYIWESFHDTLTSSRESIAKIEALGFRNEADEKWESRDTGAHKWCMKTRKHTVLYMIYQVAPKGERSKQSSANMAEHLASIFGTEKDRVNCPFYFKIGWVPVAGFVCMHGCGVVWCGMPACVCVCVCFAFQAPLLHAFANLHREGSLFPTPTTPPLPPPCSSCRHGDRCSRMHNRPTISQTILLQNMYQNPVINAPLGPDGLPTRVDEKAAQQEYEVRREGLGGKVPWAG